MAEKEGRSGAEVMAAEIANGTPVREFKYQEVLSAQRTIQSWIDNARKGHPHGALTGWSQVDVVLGQPMDPGEIIVVAARTGVGKSWITQWILDQYLQGNEDSSAIFFTLEMSAPQLGGRLASYTQGKSREDIEYELATDLSEEITGESMVNDHPAYKRLSIYDHMLKAEELGRYIDKVTEETGTQVRMVAIDFLGLVISQAGRSKYERLSDVLAQLKAVAKEGKCIILLIAQLSRSAGSGYTEPSLEDLRDSGEIEELSDRILMFWRESIEYEGDDTNRIWVKVGKNRWGKITMSGSIPLEFDQAMRPLQPGGNPTQGVLATQPDDIPF